MAVVEVKEIFNGRSGNWTLDRKTRKYSRVYHVLTNDANDDARTVMAAAGMPEMGEPFPGDAGCLLKEKSARQGATQFIWEVNCSYDSQYPDPNQDENPLNRPAVWRISFEKSKEVLTEDRAGVPLENSAGTPFIPPVEVDKSDLKLTVERNRLFTIYGDENELLDVLALIDHINDDDVSAGDLGTFPRWSLKLDNIEMQQVFENALVFYRVTYSLSVRLKDNPTYDPETDPITDKYVGDWNPVEILDQGFEKVVDGKKTAIRDRLGSVKATPTYLSSSGEPQMGENGEPVNPNYLPFQLYEFGDFSIIP